MFTNQPSSTPAPQTTQPVQPQTQVQQAQPVQPSGFGALLAKMGIGGHTKQPAVEQTNGQVTQPSAQQQTAPTPEAFFSDLFSNQQNDTSKKEEKTSDKPDSKQPRPWDTSEETLASNFGNLDVSRYVSPDDMTAALGGDVAAFAKILNIAASLGAMSSYQAAVNSSKQGVDQVAQQIQQGIPEQFKKHHLDVSLGQDPVLSAPHLQPVVNAVRTSILAKYPQATEADIRTGVHAYLQELGSKYSTPNHQDAQPQAAQSIDWDAHFQSLK